MTPTNVPTRVLFMGDPGSIQQQITTALNAEPEFQLVDVLATTEMLARDLRAANAEIILIDHQLGGQPTLDIIDDIALQFPDMAVVTILPGNDPLAIQQVMLAGARGFLVQPFTQVNLLSTLRRVNELEKRRVKSPTTTAKKSEFERPLRTMAVFSPRGGVGCSTLAINLAVNLYEETAGRVLLMDGKLFFGHLDVMLNVRTRNTLADLIPHAANLDEGLIKDVITDHVSGIHVLLAPTDVQTAQGIRPDDLYSVFVGLQRAYDHIVIDSGSYLSENAVTLLDAADRILLVTTPDLASLHSTSRFIQVSRSLGYPADKILVVVNRAGIPGGVKTSDIESALHQQFFAQIPDDGANALRSLNRGIPLAIRYPRSPASKALKVLAKNLSELSLADAGSLAAGMSGEKAHQEALMSSSRLG